MARQFIAGVTVRPRRASCAAQVMAPCASGSARSFCRSRGWASAARRPLHCALSEARGVALGRANR
jgi:hypothetical protein